MAFFWSMHGNLVILCPIHNRLIMHNLSEYLSMIEQQIKDLEYPA